MASWSWFFRQGKNGADLMPRHAKRQLWQKRKGGMKKYRDCRQEIAALEKENAALEIEKLRLNNPEYLKLLQTITALCIGFPKDAVMTVAAGLASTVLIGASAADRRQASEMMRDMCLFDPDDRTTLSDF
jgi:hypothetical protein